MKKVTALLDEDLLADVQEITQGKNLTDSIYIALRDYVKRIKLRRLLKEMRESKEPLFQDFDYEAIRELNRKVT